VWAWLEWIDSWYTLQFFFRTSWGHVCTQHCASRAMLTTGLCHNQSHANEIRKHGKHRITNIASVELVYGRQLQSKTSSLTSITTQASMLLQVHHITLKSLSMWLTVLTDWNICKQVKPSLKAKYFIQASSRQKTHKNPCDLDIQ